jgi:serine protease
MHEQHTARRIGRARSRGLVHAVAFSMVALVAISGAGAAAATVPAAAAQADPLVSQQYGLRQSRFTTAWRKERGKGVVIAIVDTGIDTSHPDLSPNLVTGRDFVDGGIPTDRNGHGTHVAGIAAAAGDNGIGGSGGAPAAKLMPIRVLDETGAGDPAVIAEGIDWAVAEGATVINLSLGGSGLSARLLKGGQINRSIRAAYEAGAVVVAAAGNDGRALRSYRFGVPVLVVNAVDSAGRLASFSNYADARAVSAAGVDIVSTAPTNPTPAFPQGTRGYGTLSGTSMAAPLVAGEAALLLGRGLSAAETIDVIAATAKPTGEDRLGAGIVDATAAVKAKPSDSIDAAGTPATSAPNRDREFRARDRIREQRGAEPVAARAKRRVISLIVGLTAFTALLGVGVVSVIWLRRSRAD